MATSQDSLDNLYDDFGLLESGDAAPQAQQKLSKSERKRLAKQRKLQQRKAQAAKKSGVLTDLVMDDIEIGEDFEELETYAVTPPFSYVRILFDKRDYSRLYFAVEPKTTPDEQEDLELIKEVLIRAFNIDRDILDEDQGDFLKQAVDDIIDGYRLKSRRSNRDKIHYMIHRDMVGYGKIDVLMKDPNIEDVSCDGPNVETYVYHRRFESLRTNVIWTDEHVLEQYIIRLAQRCGKHISVAEPLLDATLMDGSRIVMTLGREISTRGSTFTIRRFRDEPFTPVDLLEFKTFSAMQIGFLWMAFQYGMSMLFVGGTASGKTTSLNALSLFLPWQHKIVSIEETRELNLPHPNWIPGCTRQGFGGEAGADGKAQGEVDMYDLLRAALRERPEYIIVGEIRGAEAYVLFQAMATGHTTYSTFHADSVQSLVHRLENKPIEIPRVLIPALDGLSIQIQTRVGGKRVRRCKQVVEIIGIDPHSGELLTNEAFRWNNSSDDYEFSGKSYILEKIMLKANLNRVEIMDELKRRQLVIEWCLKKSIRDYREFAKVVAEYYVHPDDVMRHVYAEMQTGGRKKKRRIIRGTKKIAEESGPPLDLIDFPPKVQAQFQKRMAKEEAFRARIEAKLATVGDEAKRAKIEAQETQRRTKVEARLETDLLKTQARYAPLKQLKPLADNLNLGDVSALNPKWAGQLLQQANREMQQRAKAEQAIGRAAANATRQAKLTQKEEQRRTKVMQKLQKLLVKGLAKSGG